MKYEGKRETTTVSKWRYDGLSKVGKWLFLARLIRDGL